MIILFLAPIVLKLIVSPLWFVLEKCVTLSVVEIILNAVVIPLYYTIIIAKKMMEASFLNVAINHLISFVICLICCFITYSNWGIKTGYFYTPDSITLLILQLEIITSMIILAIGLSVIYVIKSQE